MYISRIPNRSSPPAILLRESFREQGKVKTRTLANLSKLPDEAISLLKRFLAGEREVEEVVDRGSRTMGNRPQFGSTSTCRSWTIWSVIT